MVVRGEDSWGACGDGREGVDEMECGWEVADLLSIKLIDWLV